MANWANVTTVITHDDSLMMDRLTEAATPSKESYDLVSCSDILSSLGVDHSKYLDGLRAFVRDVEREGDTLIINFDSAWCEPYNFHFALEDLGYEIIWAASEPGCRYFAKHDPEGYFPDYDIDAFDDGQSGLKGLDAFGGDTYFFCEDDAKDALREFLSDNGVQVSEKESFKELSEKFEDIIGEKGVIGHAVEYKKM